MLVEPLESFIEVVERPDEEELVDQPRLAVYCLQHCWTENSMNS